MFFAQVGLGNGHSLLQRGFRLDIEKDFPAGLEMLCCVFWSRIGSIQILALPFSIYIALCMSLNPCALVPHPGDEILTVSTPKNGPKYLVS